MFKFTREIIVNKCSNSCKKINIDYGAFDAFKSQKKYLPICPYSVTERNAFPGLVCG